MSTIKTLADVYTTWSEISLQCVHGPAKMVSHHSHVSLAEHIRSMSPGTLQEFARSFLLHDVALHALGDTPIGLGGKR